MKTNLTFTFVSLLILTTIILSPIVIADNKTASDSFARWEKVIKTFESWDDQNAPPKDPILFVGSSSIRMWKTRLSFPDLPVMNRGFGGSQTFEVNHFYDRIIKPYKPKLVLLYCGDNDIAFGKTAERVLDDYKKFVDLIHTDMPETKIIYISIKPSGSRWKLWPQMKDVNDKIAEFTRTDKRLYYADCASCLLDNGKPNDSLFIEDRLHLNKQGYKTWTKVLRPIIDNVLKK